MKGLLRIVIASVALAFVIGCGGNVPGGDGVGEGPKSGSLAVSIRWPDPSRLIPVIADRIELTIDNKMMPASRLAGEDMVTITIQDIPEGEQSCTAKAFKIDNPNDRSTWKLVASGTSNVRIVGGETSKFSIVMESELKEMRVTVRTGENSERSVIIAANEEQSVPTLTLGRGERWTYSAVPWNKEANAMALLIDNNIGPNELLVSSTPGLDVSSETDNTTGTTEVKGGIVTRQAVGASETVTFTYRENGARFGMNLIVDNSSSVSTETNINIVNNNTLQGVGYNGETGVQVLRATNVDDKVLVTLSNFNVGDTFKIGRGSESTGAIAVDNNNNTTASNIRAAIRTIPGYSTATVDVNAVGFEINLENADGENDRREIALPGEPGGEVGSPCLLIATRLTGTGTIALARTDTDSRSRFASPTVTLPWGSNFSVREGTSLGELRMGYANGVLWRRGSAYVRYDATQTLLGSVISDLCENGDPDVDEHYALGSSGLVYAFNKTNPGSSTSLTGVNLVGDGRAIAVSTNKRDESKPTMVWIADESGLKVYKREGNVLTFVALVGGADVEDLAGGDGYVVAMFGTGFQVYSADGQITYFSSLQAHNVSSVPSDSRCVAVSSSGKVLFGSVTPGGSGTLKEVTFTP